MKRDDYISFISSVTVGEYLKAKNYLDKGNDISASGGVFYICKTYMEIWKEDPEGYAMFENMLQVSKILYKIAEDKGFIDLNILMISASNEKYTSALKGIQEYMLTEYDSLSGELMKLIWQSLSEFQNEPEKKVYWDRFVQLLFTFLRMAS